MTVWNEHEDAISDAIDHSIDMDWTSRTGAKAVVAWLNDNAPAAPQAAGVGERVRSACADFREAIDYFEADVADVMAEGSERADLWDREVTVNIDALKAVMNAALRAPSREPEGGAVRDEIERLIAEAVLSASVETPETFGERVAMRESITRNLTNAILAVLSPEAPAREGE